MSGDGRGQTTLDFAVGMSVFIAIVLFMFLFVPGILDPFTTGTQEEAITANRIADTLVQQYFAAPTSPNDLSAGCTVMFFDHAAPGGSSVDTCGFSGENLTDIVGVDHHQQLNVTIRGNVSAGDGSSDVLCWHTAGEELVEKDDAPGSCDLALTAGDQLIASNQDTVTALRVGSLDGEAVTIEVEMW